jgi:Sulfotransferase family
MTLPNAFLIGARRSGTTSLAATLGLHPQVFVSSPKETHFWTRNRHGDLPDWLDATARRVAPRDLSEYEALFTYARPQQRVRLDASTSYLEDHGAAIRIARIVPDARIICMLRQPVDQAFSIFVTWHGGQVPDDHPIERFVAAMVRPPMQYPLSEHGLYSRHLLPYFDAFGPEQIRVILYEDLIKWPDQELQALLDWLGIDPTIFLPLHRLNASGAAAVPALQSILARNSWLKHALRRNLPISIIRTLTRWHHWVWSANVRPARVVPPTLRAELTDRWYSEDINRLERLLMRNLDGWRPQVSRPDPVGEIANV